MVRGTTQRDGFFLPAQAFLKLCVIKVKISIITIFKSIIRHVISAQHHPKMSPLTGSRLGPEFVYVHTRMNWSSAQLYCRKNFVDLATIKNYRDNKQVHGLIPTYKYPWIGLYIEPNHHWSDGSRVLFTSWDTTGILIGSRAVICGSTSTGRSGRWKMLSCETRLPFVCYGPPGELTFKMVNNNKQRVDR
uniref:C-type lectin domain-containing protein n=1 Tax=Cyprinodon variegatus TaxID=28743 RepID=A0A3Q2FEE0_CYPVA